MSLGRKEKSGREAKLELRAKKVGSVNGGLLESWASEALVARKANEAKLEPKVSLASGALSDCAGPTGREALKVPLGCKAQRVKPEVRV